MVSNKETAISLSGNFPYNTLSMYAFRSTGITDVVASVVNSVWFLHNIENDIMVKDSIR